jgi:hypothetical protein
VLDVKPTERLDVCQFIPAALTFRAGYIIPEQEKNVAARCALYGKRSTLRSVYEGATDYARALHRLYAL